MLRKVKKGSANLGTFFGVYLPCVLTILCVVMYIRLGWIAGNLGLVKTWILITMASSITFITGLSVAAISTNMKVGGGGSYYMISRSLGLEFGAAIGLPLFLGKALGVSFYVVGFSESIQAYFPILSLPVIGSITLVILTAIALISTSIAAKSQLLVFGMILASLIGLALGGPVEAAISAAPPSSTAAAIPVSFWVAFAIFFPAVTGIEAGVGLSGDLKDPKKSLPVGTIGAIVTGYLIYMIVPVLMLAWVPLVLLQSDPLIMREVMPHASLFYAGVWGAALSSALISLLAAPRTLQKLARDGIIYGALGHGSKADDTPRLATLLTFCIVLGGVWSGGLNQIAKALSMFFLTTYGLLNFAAAMEILLDNPSWRPTFKVKWWLSFMGSIASFTVMFFLNSLASLAAILIGIGIYFWVHKRHLNRRWEDIRMGLWQFLTKILLYRLKDYKPDLRSWRPNLLVFIGSPTKRWYLAEMADALSQNHGLMTLASMIPAEEREDQVELIQKSIEQALQKKDITALTRTHRTRNLIQGMRHMIHYYGLGSIKPNSILLGPSQDEAHELDFADLLMEINRSKLNLILAKEHEIQKEERRSKGRTIDIWWGGHKRNLGFMLSLAYLMKHSKAWAGAQIRVLSVVEHESKESSFQKNLQEIIAGARIPALAKVLVLEEGQDIFSLMREQSSKVDVLLTGMRSPEDGEEVASYKDYYVQLLSQLPQCPLTMQVLASENLPFFNLLR